jgi:hypothetical protein
MMKLYRQHVLQEAAGPELVQIGSIGPAPTPKAAPEPVAPAVKSTRAEEREEVGSFGD